MPRNYADLVAEGDKRFDVEATSWKKELEERTSNVIGAVRDLARVATGACGFERAATEDGRKLDVEAPDSPFEGFLAALTGLEGTRQHISEILGEATASPDVVERYNTHVAAVEALEAADDETDNDAEPGDGADGNNT